MSAGLAHSPAQKQQSDHFSKRNVDIDPGSQGSGRGRSKDRAVFKLFDDSANVPALDPYSDGERAVRAAVSKVLDADMARPQAAQKPTEGRALGSGGATVPHSEASGNEGHPLPLSSISEAPSFKGSSSVGRYALLHKIQRLCRPKDQEERGPSVCGCSRPGKGATHVNVHLRYGEQTGEIRAGVSGVYRCKNAWLCPTCAPAKALERAERVQEAAEATFRRGGTSALVVLTASHSRGQLLKHVKKLVSTASSKARKTRAWCKAVDRFGILGVICGQEVTYSFENGWHYHQHLSVLVDGPKDDEMAAANGDAEKLRKFVAARAKAAGDFLAEAYKEKIRGAGGKISDKHGCKVRVAHDAEDASNYTAKGSMAWEVAGACKDETKAETSLTPWDIARAASDGDKFMFARWKEYESVMPGTVSCRRSNELCKKLGIEPDAPENNEGEQEFHEEDDVVGRVEAPVWSRWMSQGLASTFLARVEYGGEEGFDDAVAATEADSMKIDRWWRAKKAEKEAKQADRKSERLLQEAANDVRKHLHGSGSRRHIADIVERVARDNPDAPRLSPADVLTRSRCTAEPDDNDRIFAELFGVSETQWLAAA